MAHGGCGAFFGGAEGGVGACVCSGDVRMTREEVCGDGGKGVVGEEEGELERVIEEEEGEGADEAVRCGASVGGGGEGDEKAKGTKPDPSSEIWYIVG